MALTAKSRRSSLDRTFQWVHSHEQEQEQSMAMAMARVPADSTVTVGSSRFALRSIPDAVAALAAAEKEKLKYKCKSNSNSKATGDTVIAGAGISLIVERLVEVVADMAVAEFGHNSRAGAGAARDWWAMELTALPIESYRMVIMAMKRRGLPYAVLGSSLMTYAQASLRGLVPPAAASSSICNDDDDNPATCCTPNNNHHLMSGSARTSSCVCDDHHGLELEEEQRILIETIINLLPVERNALSVSFLCGLLRSAKFLGARQGYLLEVERRIASQLEQATENDLVAMADVEAVKRIVTKFMDSERRRSAIINPEAAAANIDDYHYHAGGWSPAVSKVTRTLDAYLAAIAAASDDGSTADSTCISMEEFVGVARVVPAGARESHDGLYRAVDVYLKKHPWLEELQREKVCSVLDTHQLSFEARTHASQNKRLPLNIVLQVLYHDQLAVRSTAAGAAASPSGHAHAHVGNVKVTKLKNGEEIGGGGGGGGQVDMVTMLCKENEQLRQEVARMKAALRTQHHSQQLPQPQPQPQLATAGKVKNSSSNSNSSSRKGGGSGNGGRLLASVAKGLGRLNPFARSRGGGASKDIDNLFDHNNNPCSDYPSAAPTPSRRRRFSIS